MNEGKHGMHFHKVANCKGAGFKASKGHIMPEGKPHGFLNAEGPHAGNLPNLVIAENGQVHVELYSNIVTYAEGAAALLDDDGSALIIHENIDDHFTQPIGGSGGRIGCAEIKR
jgi:Cu-Zn family superoxide dismutase